MATPDASKVNSLIKQATDARKSGNESKYKQFMSAANAEQQKAVSAPGWGEALVSPGAVKKLENMGKESIQHWQGAPGVFVRGVNDLVDVATGNASFEQGLGSWLTGQKTDPAPSKNGGSGKTKQPSLQPASVPTTQPVNPYEEAANKMAQQYLDMISNLGKQTSQQSFEKMSDKGTADALALIGESSGSPSARYLDQQSKIAGLESQSSGMTAAEQSLRDASNVGAMRQAQGMQEMGKAEATMMGVAQYQQLLNALSNEAYYNIYRGNTIPKVPNAPAGINAAIEGVTAATSGGGGAALPSFMAAAASAGQNPTGTSTSTGLPN